MNNEKIIYTVYWNNDAAHSYLYGTELTFGKNEYVYFDNQIMPPGQVINKWLSKGDYLSKRTESDLPILKYGFTYKFKAYMKDEPTGSVLIKIEFYGADDKIISSVNTYEKEFDLIYPDKTDNWTISFISTSGVSMEFERIDIYECDVVFGKSDNLDRKDNSDCNKIINYNSNLIALNIYIPKAYRNFVRFPDEKNLIEENVFVLWESDLSPERSRKDDWLTAIKDFGFKEFNIISEGGRFASYETAVISKLSSFGMRYKGNSK